MLLPLGVAGESELGVTVATETSCPKSFCHKRQTKRATSRSSTHSRRNQKQKKQLVKPEDAEPVLLTHKILKTVMTSSKPPNSQELWVAVQEQYPGDFQSRRFFKSHLQYLQKSHLVKVASPATLGIGKSGEPYVYLPSQMGQQVDLNAEAFSALQVRTWLLPADLP
eukprot:gene4723-4975_t